MSVKCLKDLEKTPDIKKKKEISAYNYKSALNTLHLDRLDTQKKKLCYNFAVNSHEFNVATFQAA